MEKRPDYARYSDDRALLVEIGRLFIAQSPRATVRLPRALAEPRSPRGNGMRSQTLQTSRERWLAIGVLREHWPSSVWP